MSRILRTKRTVKSKLSRLHHSFGKTDNIQNIEIFEKPKVPKSILSFCQNSSINFSGTSDELKQKFNQLDQNQIQSVRSITLSIEGQKVQKQNRACIYIVFILGAILIIPMFILFSNWFKKKYREMYFTRMDTYQLISQIIWKCRNVREVHLFVQDNFVHAGKLNMVLNVNVDVRVVIVNVVEKIVFEEEGFNVWKDYFENVGDMRGRVQSVWGRTRIGKKGEKQNEQRGNILDDSTQILY